MVRKKRTDGAGESSEPHEGTGGHGGGVQRPPGQQQGGGFPQGGAQRPPGQQQGGGFPQGGGAQRAPGQQYPQGGPQRAPGQQYPQGGPPGQQFPQGGAQRAPGQQFPQGGAQRAPGQQFPQGGAQRAPGQQQPQRPQGGVQRAPGQQPQQGGGYQQGGAQRAPGQQQPFPQGGAQRVPGQQQPFPQGGAQRAPGQQQPQQGGGGRGYSGPQSQQGGGRGGRGGGGPQQYYGGAQPRGVVPQQQQSRGGNVGGPSTPPIVPDLHQAPSAPPQTIVPTQPAQPMPSKQIDTREGGGRASSSVAPPQPNPVQVTQQLQQLSIPQEESSSSMAIQPAPVSSKQMRFPLRPGKGSAGTRCIVKANHFFAQLPDKDLHQYDVSITPEVTSRGVNRAVMQVLVDLYKESHLGKRLPAYDGRKSLYTAGPLPFVSKEFKIKLVDEDDGSRSTRREREFTVVIKMAARIDLHHLELFLQGKVADAPQEAIQVLDIVLRELPTQKYCPVGRSFYSPNLGTRRPLGDGLESWRGFYQSIRPTQMGLSLNIDMSSTAFIEPLPVLDFVCELLNRDVTQRPLSDSDRVKIKKALRGVKVEVTHRGNMRRKYRIAGLTPQTTRELNFPIDDQGTMKSVVDYFQETYGFTIQFTRLPCLQVGNPQKPNYLPMEVCKIVEGQRYSKRLNEKQITELLKVTCQRPKDRENDIFQTVRANNYNEDKYAEEFGIKISDQLAVVEARVLPAPRLKYHDTGKEKDCLPQVGQWNMRNKKMVNGGAVNSWICLNFARNIDDGAAAGFCSGLAQMCNTSGMFYKMDPVLPTMLARPDQVEKVLKSRFTEAMTLLRPQGKELDLLVVILPDNNGPLYGDIKRICETELGIISQCCLAKHVYKKNPQYLANVALKINVKVGGRNTVLVDAISRRIPLLSDVPTIIFGADVTHPHPGEDSSPSIAAVVASLDWPEVTKYAGLVNAQEHRQELIQDLYKEWDGPKGKVTGGMIKELLISFYRETRVKPQRIIFYRDGVSEGQFYQVLLHEIDAIRKACASLEPNYQPPITFVIVQKRHHTRLFANNHADRNATDRSGNILPGTVVDSKICHPTEFDFYLCSHAGIQGTSRPAHYHVLWDENKFTADRLQTLTNNLCYTYARCTRSVSIVPPAFYAHLAAFRARFYMEPDTSDGGSISTAGRGGGQRGTRAAPGGANAPPVRPLPDLKDNVKRVMFYI